MVSVVKVLKRIENWVESTNFKEGGGGKKKEAIRSGSLIDTVK